MKKTLILFVSLALLFTSFAPPLTAAALGASPGESDSFNSDGCTYDELSSMPSVAAFENDFEAPTAEWLDYVGTQKPATFSKDKITCVLADNVIKINHIADNLADMGQLLSGSAVQKLSPGKIVENGGYIKKSVLDKAAGQAVENGTVVVDEAAGTAFKVTSPTVYSGVFDSDKDLSKLVKPLEGTYTVAKPALHEVVKDFELEKETITLNKANISGFAAGVQKNIQYLAVDDSDKKFKYLTGDNLIQLDFKDATVLKGKIGNSTINVKLSGGIAVGGIDVTGRYSCMGGYELSMTLQQECYLVAQLDAEVHEEIRVPLLGIDIPFGIGSVYGGIFAIIGLDGDIRLGIEARETSACTMGIKGGTFLYVPTSFHPLFEPTPPIITGDCELNGQINGFIKFGPMMGVELFGFDLVAAGVLLGAGVNTNSDGAVLDVELYASIDVYIALAGKTFNLVRARPTIYKKQQPDTKGYRVSFLETYVEPGRVGGLIEQEPDTSGGDYIPAVGLKYRVWIIPSTALTSFTASKREAALTADKNDADKPQRYKIRTYPDSGWAVTNDEGEFIQEADNICYANDQVWIEFIGKVKNKNGDYVETTVFTGPSTPVLPFTDITITYADLFNDYITGKVEPKRLIDWDADRLDPEQIQTELTYYKGPVTISPFNDYETGTQNAGKHLSYNLTGTTRTSTNEKGEFDSRNPCTDENGNVFAATAIDVLQSTQSAYYTIDENGKKHYTDIICPNFIGVKASVDANDEVNNEVIYGITPSLPDFQITRTLDYIENSYKKITEGNKVIDQMQYNEYIWIANPTGTRTVTADMLDYTVNGFSTQDYYDGYGIAPVTTTRTGDFQLTPVLDNEGNPTGTAMVSQCVTLQWVWQAHPNPITITSAENTTATAGTETVFQVTASGFLPRYSLEGAPDRVWIDEKTGAMHITPTIEPGTYTFTVKAKEGTAVTAKNAPDPKKGNASSDPDTQAFTLTVLKNTSTTVPTTAAPSTEKPAEKTPPVIFEDEYNTYMIMDGSADFSITYKASGSKPITWSLISSNGGSIPAAFSINKSTGVFTVKKSVAPGTYSFLVKASNSAGTDTLDCTMIVAQPTQLNAPAFTARRDSYQFGISTVQTDWSVQLSASGSAPITYSLEPVNARIPVPSFLSINASTGLLSVKTTATAGLSVGVYDFIVKAQNTAGTDTRICKLTISAPLMFGNKGALSLSPLLSVFTAAVNTFTGKQLAPAKPSLSGTALPNALTIRCDDAKDVYTHDRTTVNGAAYLLWDTHIMLTFLNRHTGDDHSFSSKLTASYEIKDPTPICDKYHYYAPGVPSLPISDKDLNKIKNDMKKVVKAKLAEYKNGYQSKKPAGTGALSDSYNFLSSSQNIVRTSLAYGALVNEIQENKGGSFTQELTAETGSTVSDAYFTALEDNKKATLTFKQDGADISFTGRDVKNADSAGLMDIGLTNAPNDKAILDSIGSGYDSFTYAFQHHGALPGTATFTIITTLSEGMTVNVYKFGADGGFTLIAKEVPVGKNGAVTYQNNTMSEYVITTKVIEDAALSDMFGLLDSDSGFTWWIVGTTGIAVLLAATGITVFIVLKKKRGLKQSAEPVPAAPLENTDTDSPN